MPTICSICQSSEGPVAGSRRVFNWRVGQCGHCFHSACANKWFNRRASNDNEATTRARHRVCPLCNRGGQDNKWFDLDGALHVSTTDASSSQAAPASSPPARLARPPVRHSSTESGQELGAPDQAQLVRELRSSLQRAQADSTANAEALAANIADQQSLHFKIKLLVQAEQSAKEKLAYLNERLENSSIANRTLSHKLNEAAKARDIEKRTAEEAQREADRRIKEANEHLQEVAIRERDIGKQVDAAQNNANDLKRERDSLRQGNTEYRKRLDEKRRQIHALKAAIASLETKAQAWTSVPQRIPSADPEAPKRKRSKASTESHNQEETFSQLLSSPKESLPFNDISLNSVFPQQGDIYDCDNEEEYSFHFAIQKPDLQLNVPVQRPSHGLGLTDQMKRPNQKGQIIGPKHRKKVHG